MKTTLKLLPWFCTLWPIKPFENDLLCNFIEARYLLVQNYQEPTKSVLACIEKFVFNASLMSGNLCPSTDLDMKLKEISLWLKCGFEPREKEVPQTIWPWTWVVLTLAAAFAAGGCRSQWSKQSIAGFTQNMKSIHLPSDTWSIKIFQRIQLFCPISHFYALSQAKKLEETKG